ncbi:membrane-anchored junction protein isoform 7-T16 [Geothlypis trichas]
MGPSETPPKPPKIPHASPPRLPLVAGWAPVYSLPGLQLPKTVGPRRTPIEPGLRFRRALRPVRGPWGPGLSPKHCPGCSPSASLNRKCAPGPLWCSGREREMSLKPFTYPLPETRFLHAGRHVYKFKIRYGNFNSSPNLSLTESAAKESEEVIRIILGNLDDLHPFSTDHFTVFPYLSKWERVSKMKFKHENVHLMPYPYICTLYLELNSFQRNISCGFL